MSDGILRVSAHLPLAQAEEARARALEVAPGGFEEAEAEGEITLCLYVEAAAVASVLNLAGRTGGVRSTALFAPAASGSGRRGNTPTPASRLS